VKAARASIARPCAPTRSIKGSIYVRSKTILPKLRSSAIRRRAFLRSLRPPVYKPIRRRFPSVSRGFFACHRRFGQLASRRGRSAASTAGSSAEATPPFPTTIDASFPSIHTDSTDSPSILAQPSHFSVRSDGNRDCDFDGYKQWNCPANARLPRRPRCVEPVGGFDCRTAPGTGLRHHDAEFGSPGHIAGDIAVFLWRSDAGCSIGDSGNAPQRGDSGTGFIHRAENRLCIEEISIMSGPHYYRGALQELPGRNMIKSPLNIRTARSAKRF
jgi:hypothetical protein